MSSIFASVWRGVHYAGSFAATLSRAVVLAPWRALGSFRSFIPGPPSLLGTWQKFPAAGLGGASANASSLWQRWPSGFALRWPTFQVPWLSFFVFVGLAGVQSVKTLQHPTVPGARQWLTYWILLASIKAVEASLRNFNQWETVYALARLGLCAWLVHPATRGAETLALVLQRIFMPLAQASEEGGGGGEGGTSSAARPAQGKDQEPTSGESREPALERELAGVSKGATSAGGTRKATDVALPVVGSPADPQPRGSMIPVMVPAETRSEPAFVKAEDALLPEIPMGEVNAGTQLKTWEEASPP